MGNRVAYLYKLVNVQTTGSKIRTPFKKITYYDIETTSPATADITVTSNADKTSTNKEAVLTLAVDAEAQGNALVVGLL